MSADRETMLTRAADMRRAPTEAERRLWRHLRASQLGGHKFRRQAVIGERIVDFFCPAKGLIIELDGDTHEPAQDLRRDARLHSERGFTCLRFGNADIITNIDGVLETILTSLAGLPDHWPGHTTPDPSSEEEGS